MSDFDDPARRLVLSVDRFLWSAVRVVIAVAQLGILVAVWIYLGPWSAIAVTTFAWLENISRRLA